MPKQLSPLGSQRSACAAVQTLSSAARAEDARAVSSAARQLHRLQGQASELTDYKQALAARAIVAEIAQLLAEDDAAAGDTRCGTPGSCHGDLAVTSRCWPSVDWIPTRISAKASTPRSGKAAKAGSRAARAASSDVKRVSHKR